ncbi:metal ABC transporter permease [Desulfurivibrio alkaliphilus]|uniref:ABC-3 protein n=1 Tax=Desulfurivibrio alkaliphilus (strain DSM 19089 / UNIQEM U267 / AHT2) TaxID=589865 RepID=D6Z137_DESAT|nr:metal ABC transporter permease [Desulfurivibrio alkaliphilus]ADH87297.1 ABC-3 protein [Desulfurivibrio alkaliphilus AHT 2]
MPLEAWDSLLLWPFVGGLLMAVLLGLGGAAFFVRGSAWQGLALAQGAASGGLVASVLAWPLVPTALAFSAVLMGVLQRHKDQERLALVIFLLALAASILLASNFSQASLSAARWAEGQVYFLTLGDIYWILSLVALTLLLLPWLYRTWLLSQLGADQGQHRKVKAWAAWMDLGWRLLLVVVGSMTLGLSAALACLLLPAWTAALLAPDFRRFLLLSSLFSVTAFLIAWALALTWDQPFAPVLVVQAAFQAVAIYLFLLSKKVTHAFSGR